MRTDKQKTTKELRKFGLVMAIPFSLFATIGWWRGSGLWVYLAGVAAVFALLGLIAPNSLRWFETAWMRLAVAIGRVMTTLILIVAFFLVFTPLGVLMRLFGRRPLTVGFDASAATYWEPVEQNSPYTRADKPY